MKYDRYQVNDMGWAAFIGKIVTKFEINENKDVIRFTLSDGSVLFASAVGDCCSRSWFEHIEGADALIGHTVLAAVDRDMPEGKKNAEFSLTQFYGWTLETSRGRFDIEMRNESNGFYGGNVIISDVISDQYHCEIEKPFIPAAQQSQRGV